MNEQKWVNELALRLQEMAMERFSLECVERDKEKNIAVLTGALVRAGTLLVCRYCPEEKVPAAIQSLMLQVRLAMEEWQPNLSGGLAAANEGLMPEHVEGEIGDPEKDPEK
jgi:hypothetical protein